MKITNEMLFERCEEKVFSHASRKKNHLEELFLNMENVFELYGL
jgi:hypothetical protein